MSETIWAGQALLAEGWASSVRVVLGDQGDITEVLIDQPPDSATWRVEVLLPGMANVHSHAHQRAMAGLAEHGGAEGASPDSFWSWREAMYRYLQRLDPEQLEAIAAQLYLEMLKAGYTCVGEFQYLHHDPRGRPYAQRAELTLRCYQAARTAGIAFCALPVLYAYGGFCEAPPAPGQARFVNPLDRYLRLVEDVQGAVGVDRDASCGVAPHSLRAVSPALLQGLLDARGAQAPAPIHLHIAEQQREVEDCRAWCGKRPIAWLLGRYAVDSHWCLIHATHMNEQEVRAVAASGARVGLCPSTEANLGDGLFDGAAYLAAGGRWAIGSDSNVSVDPVEELRWLEYGQRLRHQERNVLAGPGESTGAALYTHAAREGSAACGRIAGVIAAGRRADLIALDAQHPRLYGAEGDRCLDRWVFSGNTPLVNHVWVGARQVVADGHHAQEESIAERFRRAMTSLKHA